LGITGRVGRAYQQRIGGELMVKFTIGFTVDFHMVEFTMLLEITSRKKDLK